MKASDFKAFVLLVMALITCQVTAKGNVPTIDWIELLPEDERATYAIPEPQHDLDSLGDILEQEFGEPKQQPAAKMVYDYHDKDIRIPGFVVPLEIDNDGNVKEFFLVPYFGACIHVPPPPPNQIIHVFYDKGLALKHIRDPFWVTGRLKVSNVVNYMAEAGYQLNANDIELYDIN